MEWWSDGFETQYSNIPLLQHSICARTRYAACNCGISSGQSLIVTGSGGNPNTLR
jgi:hypothetical protein